MPLLAVVLLAVPPLSAERAVIDRGEVRVGPPLVETFKLTNRSGEPLLITGVASSCGCLAPRVECRELAPGASTSVTIDVNTLSQPAGPVKWVTRVAYQCGGEHNELVLELNARLTAEVRVEPAALAFQIRQARSVTVTVTDSRTRPFRLTAAGTSSEYLTAELSPPGDDPHVSRIRVTAAAGGPPGTTSATAWFSTDDLHYPQVQIPVTVTTASRRPVTASPSSVSLSGGSTLVQLRDREGRPVIVERVELPATLTARWTAGPGRASTLRLAAAATGWGSRRTADVVVHLREPAGETVIIAVDWP